MLITEFLNINQNEYKTKTQSNYIATPTEMYIIQSIVSIGH